MTRLRPEGEEVKVWGEHCTGGPSAVSTETPGWSTPAGFSWQGAPYCILNVCTRWRVHTRWWEPDQALWREYLKVLVAPAASVAPAMMAGDLGSKNIGSASGGLLCLLYRDLLSGDWFLARIYD